MSALVGEDMAHFWKTFVNFRKKESGERVTHRVLNKSKYPRSAVVCT